MSDNIHVRDLSVDVGEFEFRASDDGDGLSLAGYITKFGESTLIDDWLGSYTEEIKRGAFAKTLNERGPSKVKMQVDHGHDALFGSLPIGVWTDIREDRKGLFGEGRLHDTWHTVPIRAAIESGALEGMSFRFKVVAEQWRKGDPQKGTIDHRVISEVALFEAGPVVFPAYEGTTVGLRSRALELFRRELAPRRIPMDDTSSVRADTMPVEKAVAPVGDTDPVRAEAGPPVGITRREMRQQALSALGVIHDSDRGAA
jgi:HK97 family phage prohead protease